MACLFGGLMKRPARAPAHLSDSLHRRLNAYALAASAVGVGVAALSQPALAKIVYTPAHVVISSNTYYDLDLNNDGTPEVQLRNRASSLYSFLYANSLNDTRVRGPKRVGTASALTDGIRIGADNEHFKRQHYFMFATSHRGNEYGYWANVSNRYLGVRFKIKGTTHYGWARLSVKIDAYEITALLTGYAYETVPNKPIIAGKTHGKDEPTLGRLAQGASSVSNEGKP
jgi:hypothetical protein